MLTLLTKFVNKAESISWWKYFLLVSVFAGVVFFSGIDSHGLWGGDEPRVAGISADMVRRGNWLTPMLDGKLFLEKPPLYFWAVAGSLHQFGINDTAARLPSATAAFLGILALFALARKLRFSKLGALFSAVMLATSAQFWEAGSKCMIDIFLATFVIFAMWCFYGLCGSDSLFHKILWYWGFILALGGAIFTKSLIGLAIPASAIFVWLAIDDFYFAGKFRFERWLWLFSASAFAFVPVSYWALAIFFKHGPDAVYTLVWTNNFGRFLGSGQEHVGPVYYYLRKLPEQLQPWTFLLPFAIFYHFWRCKQHKDGKSLYMLCWLLVPYLLLTLSAGKRQIYVLPLYAAEILMIGSLTADLLEDKIRLKIPKRKAWINLVVRIFAWIFCAGLLVAPLVFAGIAIHGNLGWMPFFVQLLLMGCGFWLLYSLLHHAQNQTGFAILTGLALVYVNIDTTVFNSLNYKYTYRPVFECCNMQINNGKELFLYLPDERISGGAMYYLDEQVPSIDTEKIEEMRNDPEAEQQVFLAEDDNFHRLKNVEIIAMFKVKRDKIYLFRFKHSHKHKHIYRTHVHYTTSASGGES